MIIGGGTTADTPAGARVGVMWVDDSVEVPTVALAVLDRDGERKLEVAAGDEVTLEGSAYRVSEFGRDNAGFPYAVLLPAAGER